MQLYPKLGIIFRPWTTGLLWHRKARGGGSLGPAGQQQGGKEVPCTFMLGIKRTLTENEGVRKLKMSMDAYVEGMHHAFQPHVPTAKINTPCEHNLLLSLQNESDEAEHQRVLARRGPKMPGSLPREEGPPGRPAFGLPGNALHSAVGREEPRGYV